MTSQIYITAVCHELLKDKSHNTHTHTMLTHTHSLSLIHTLYDIKIELSQASKE